jgi:hypothetical protein
MSRLSIGGVILPVRAMLAIPEHNGLPSKTLLANIYLPNLTKPEFTISNLTSLTLHNLTKTNNT